MLEALVLVVCILICSTSSVNGATDPTQASALRVMYTSLNSSPQLTGWSSTGDDPCGQSWKGVTCSGSSVTEIKLSSLQLSGSMGYQLDSLTALTNFDMSNNNLGNSIPYQLPPNLQRLNLAGNSFNGGLPYSISQMTSLKYLNVSRNQLQGELGGQFGGQLTGLSTLDLSFNTFTGNLPQGFSSLSSINSMFLQNNQFTGPIDVLADLPLQNLNVGNNHFTGWIPPQLRKLNNNLQIDGNSWTNGPAPPPPPFTPPPTNRRTNPGQRSGGNNSPSDNGGGGKKSGIGGGGVAGIVISVLVVGAIVVFFLVKRKSKSSLDEEKLSYDRPFTPLASNEVKEMKSVQTSSAANTKTLETSLSINLKPPPIDRHKSFDEDEFSNKPIVKRTNTATINATIFSVADLQMATGSFSVENLIGEGSMGRVYRGQFDDGKVLAVKKINSSAVPNQSPEDFLEVVSSVSQLHHPNVTELVGYCCEHGQYLLVYAFHKNGSLHDYLHLSDDYNKPLTWSTRVKIALGTARALEYLHEVCSPSVVHENFKSANILLDLELNPHLSECGLGSFVPDTEHEASNQNTGSGYTAPEVVMSGQYTLKSDVYSFGVVMLELLTGRKPFDSSRPRSEQSLVRWATPQLHDIDALAKMVDPSLKGLYPAKSLSRFADVVALCVQPEPEFRPPMSEVVQALVRLVQRANMSKRTTGGEEQRSTPRADDSDIQEYMF
ncbi:protein STRUBBELIG-RECEPTOR FAMILY 6-like [Magnolia sinica]|uniref:protein STRUBBELIG-RECEPTOR FAMILY 6-like n=1 Tax=Magnolia sinica TaxID=86752 RepID=UPI00265A0F9E|nr:protein STRUBBELIG-RECEPTOR FAMILY 6-like [Magnolia sinica]